LKAPEKMGKREVVKMCKPISVLLCLGLFGTMGMAVGSGATGEPPRQTISLDQDWKFHRGSLPLPGRIAVAGWRSRMEPKGEETAL
jgi:hypothetical protein